MLEFGKLKLYPGELRHLLEVPSVYVRRYEGGGWGGLQLTRIPGPEGEICGTFGAQEVKFWPRGRKSQGLTTGSCGSRRMHGSSPPCVQLTVTSPSFCSEGEVSWEGCRTVCVGKQACVWPGDHTWASSLSLCLTGPEVF